MVVYQSRFSVAQQEYARVAQIALRAVEQRLVAYLAHGEGAGNGHSYHARVTDQAKLQHVGRMAFLVNELQCNQLSAFTVTADFPLQWLRRYFAVNTRIYLDLEL